MKKKNNEGKSSFLGIIVFLLIIIGGLIIYSRYIGTKGIIVKEYKIESNKLSDKFDGMKVIHFSDIHYGRTFNLSDLEQLVNTINELKVDIVVFSGDFLDRDINISGEEQESVSKLLKSINSSIVKLSVNGNHDYDNDIDVFNKIMLNGGFEVLNNESKIIYNKDIIPIYVLGLDNNTYNDYNFNDILDNDLEIYKDLYKLVIVHEPDTIKELRDYNFDLMLSGHSHGGQVRLPFLGAIIKPDLAKSYYDDFYKVDDTLLYISSGLGTSTIPFRFYNKPSINFYRFYKI